MNLINNNMFSAATNGMILEQFNITSAMQQNRIASMKHNTNHSHRHRHRNHNNSRSRHPHLKRHQHHQQLEQRRNSENIPPNKNGTSQMMMMNVDHDHDHDHAAHVINHLMHNNLNLELELELNRNTNTNMNMKTMKTRTAAVNLLYRRGLKSLSAITILPETHNVCNDNNDHNEHNSHAFDHDHSAASASASASSSSSDSSFVSGFITNSSPQLSSSSDGQHLRLRRHRCLGHSHSHSAAMHDARHGHSIDHDGDDDDDRNTSASSSSSSSSASASCSSMYYLSSEAADIELEQIVDEMECESNLAEYGKENAYAYAHANTSTSTSTNTNKNQSKYDTHIFGNITNITNNTNNTNKKSDGDDGDDDDYKDHIHNTNHNHKSTTETHTQSSKRHRESHSSHSDECEIDVRSTNTNTNANADDNTHTNDVVMTSTTTTTTTTTATAAESACETPSTGIIPTKILSITPVFKGEWTEEIITQCIGESTLEIDFYRQMLTEERRNTQWYNTGAVYLTHRKRVVDFICSTGIHLRLQRHTIYTAIFYFDRLCSSNQVVLAHLRFVACVMLLLASKWHEREENIPSLAHLSHACSAAAVPSPTPSPSPSPSLSSASLSSASASASSRVHTTTTTTTTTTTAAAVSAPPSSSKNDKDAGVETTATATATATASVGVMGAAGVEAAAVATVGAGAGACVAERPPPRYLVQAFEPMEQKVLELLGFQLKYTMPMDFVNFFIHRGCIYGDDILDGHNELDCHPQAYVYIRKFCIFFLDMIAQEYAFCGFRPSVLGCSVIIASRKALRIQPIWNARLAELFRPHAFADIQACYQLLWHTYGEKFPLDCTKADNAERAYAGEHENSSLPPEI